MRQVWNLTLAELRRFRGPLPILSAVFLVCVPLLYGAIYLWSNWDPYGRLGELKVAVVNLDEPVTHDGKNVQGGKDLVDQLVADDSSFAWRVVDQRAAAAGVADGSYAFSITVPKTFSADLASIGTENGPRRARVDVAFDNSQGYILGIMAETAEKELQSQLNAAAVKAYADAALGSIGQLRTGLAEAAAAGDKLSDGSRQVADGVQTLEDKVKPVVNRVSKGLTAAAKEAASVTKEVATTTADIASLAKDADGKQNEVQDALAALLAAHPELADETVVKDLRTAVKRVTTVSGEVKKVTGRVASDAKRVAGVAADVNARVPEIIGAANTAVDKVDELRSGAQKVSDGQAKLTTGLKRATGALPKLSAAERAKDADALANPVHIASHVANPAVYYGRGLAPFFFGIALWVFGLVAFVLMRAISTRGIASGTNPVLVALGGWLPPALLGSAGADANAGCVVPGRTESGRPDRHGRGLGAGGGRVHGVGAGVAGLAGPGRQRDHAGDPDRPVGWGRRPVPGCGDAGVLSGGPSIPADDLSGGGPAGRHHWGSPEPVRHGRHGAGRCAAGVVVRHRDRRLAPAGLDAAAAASAIGGVGGRQSRGDRVVPCSEPASGAPTEAPRCMGAGRRCDGLFACPQAKPID